MANSDKPHGATCDQLEDWFRAQIDNLVAHPADLRRWVEATPLGANKRELERDIARLGRECSDEAADKAQQRVWQLALEAKVESADLGRQLERLKDDLATRRSQLTEFHYRLATQTAGKRTLERAQHLFKNFWTLFDAASYEDKRELISAVVKALGGAKATKDGIIWMREPNARGGSSRAC